MNQLVDCYYSTLAALIDKHAPITSVKRRQRRSDYFFDNECRENKKVMRRLEKL